MVRTNAFAVAASVCALLVGPACATGSSQGAPAASSSEAVAPTSEGVAPSRGDSVAGASQDSLAWQGPLGQRGRLRMQIVHGSVRITAIDGGDVKVRAKRSGALRNEPWLRVERDGENVRVCSLHGGATECEAKGASNEHHGREDVEVVVEVPRGRAADVHVVSGDVTTSGVAPLQVNTVQGDVKVSLPAQQGGAIELSTVQGSLTVALPRDASVSVEATTIAGQIESAFREIVPQTRIPGQHASGTLGRGEGKLELKTVQGPIRIEAGG